MTAGMVGTASVGVVVVTHRARDRIAACLAPLQASPLRPRILVVNSSSADGTVEAAEALGADTMSVPRWRFNHGLTRELARRRLGTPVVVMLTPDAVASGPEFLERLTAPVLRGEAAVAYARQVAGPEHGLLERAGRAFSYPEHSHVRGQADRSRYGSYTHFCSNAAAAWSSAALDRIGGFKPTLVSEETVAAAELLAAGESIAYVADAVVCHAHRLGPAAAFRRQFDIGYSRRLHARLLLAGEGDLQRGRRFARGVLARALRESPAELPRIRAVLAASWAGYRTGQLGPSLPTALARRASAQDYYWT
ncbi:MAG: glycosyltransferase family 2 protein, partial [Geminicoccaceae bacterium]